MIVTLKTDHETDIKFCLDKPDDNKIIGSGFWISGWIIEKLGSIQSITLYLSEVPLVTISNFYARVDVKSAYPDYNNSLCSGFRKFVCDIPSGLHELRIVATVYQKEYTILSKTLNVLPPYDAAQVSKMMKNDWDKRAAEDAEKFVYNRGTGLTFDEYNKLSEFEPLRLAELLKTSFIFIARLNVIFHYLIRIPYHFDCSRFKNHCSITKISYMFK